MCCSVYVHACIIHFTVLFTVLSFSVFLSQVYKCMYVCISTFRVCTCTILHYTELIIELIICVTSSFSYDTVEAHSCVDNSEIHW